VGNCYLMKENIMRNKLKEKWNNKNRDTKDLRGSVYDLHPQDKALRATLLLLFT
jgi:hypothetical protein